MTRTRTLKSSFTAGEISPRLLGRGDLAGFVNGARSLRNVFVHPTGGVSRRAGLRYVAPATGAGRLVSFEFNTEQEYLLAFSDSRMDVFQDGVNVANIAVPWSAVWIPAINWAQSADTLLVVHPDVPPRKITRTSHTDWSIADWVFVDEESKDSNDVVLGNALRQPWHKFADDPVTLQPDGTAKDSSITVTASADVFDASHVNQRFRIGARQILVTAVTSATQATATVKETLLSAEATKDWEEPAFSALRGWPTTVIFHQDRLVIGGSRDLPNRLWMSKSADLFNFDLGEGLDDEAIEFAILSDQVNAIRGVFSGRHLQVFTSGAEWMVTGDPLTPSSLQLRRQTRIGSPVDRNVPPRDVDGATIFTGRTGKDLREFLFTDVEQAYQATDLAILAGHLMNAPVDQDYDSLNRHFHVVMADGAVATVTMFRSEQVTAWSRLDTDGAVRSLAVVDESVYLLLERNGGFHILILDPELNLDWALKGSNSTPTTTWSGLDHLEGETVRVVGDGAVRPDAIVSGGQIVLVQPASDIQAGLGFVHEIEPLPPHVNSPRGSGQGSPVRMVRATFRLLDTAALRVDCGSGFREIPFKRLGAGGVLDTGPQPFTGDHQVRAIGWMRGGTSSLWRIAQDIPLPCTVLSVSTDIVIND